MDGLAAPKRPGGVPQPVTSGNMLRLLQVLNRRKKVDLRTGQELLRHSNLASTQIYTLVDDDARRDGIDAISAPSAARQAA